MRERPRPFSDSIFLLRITPARAGKTYRPNLEGAEVEDHPRSCGKDHLIRYLQVIHLGSPPLVRERLKKRPERDRNRRITPARAGKTRLFRCHSKSIQDHPRSCGKDMECGYYLARKVGSPPLVRERPRPFGLTDFELGITPARAGKTSCLSLHSLFFEDHPRSCGKDHE